MAECVSCKEDSHYLYQGAMTVGGASGEYICAVPMTSARYAEYRVVQASASSSSGVSGVAISTRATPSAVTQAGTESFGLTGAGDNTLPYIAFLVFMTLNPLRDMEWTRVTDPQNQIYVTITNPSGGVCYVTLETRTHMVTVVPGPAPTVHADLEMQAAYQRSNRITEHLDKAGVPMRIVKNR